MLLAEISTADVLLLSLGMLLLFLILAGGIFLGAWKRRHASTNSPYSGTPLRRASDLPYETARKVLQFVYEHQSYNNRLFNLKKAAFCRETGRIFPDCITWLDTIDIDWNFLRKRYPGNYVSWGSLTDVQQSAIRKFHPRMSGFQTLLSSSKSAPSAVENEYAFAKPGPLYVDVDSKVLIGWKCVPDTEFEVLIVEKPKKPIEYKKKHG